MIMTTKTLLAASATLAFAAGAQAITIDNVQSEDSGSDLDPGFNNGVIQYNFDASGSDKLVVFATGEHGFNNTNGKVNSITYDGVALTQVSNRAPVTNGSDILYAEVWILDNPSAVHTAGFLDVSAATRGVITAYALSGTTAGIVQDSIGALGSRSTTINTTAGNLVLAALHVGGNGNTGATNGITADSPLNLETANTEGSNWNGQATASDTVDTSGSNTYSFTGGNVDGGFITAIEIGAIPEPGSLALLGLGGLLVARRRRG